MNIANSSLQKSRSQFLERRISISKPWEIWTVSSLYIWLIQEWPSLEHPLQSTPSLRNPRISTFGVALLLYYTSVMKNQALTKESCIVCLGYFTSFWQCPISIKILEGNTLVLCLKVLCRIKCRKIESFISNILFSSMFSNNYFSLVLFCSLLYQHFGMFFVLRQAFLV